MLKEPREVLRSASGLIQHLRIVSAEKLGRNRQSLLGQMRIVNRGNELTRVRDLYIEAVGLCRASGDPAIWFLVPRSHPRSPPNTCSALTLVW